MCHIQTKIVPYTHFFDIQFRNTSRIVFLGSKVPSEKLFHKNLKKRSYFFNYVVLENKKMSWKLSTDQVGNLVYLPSLGSRILTKLI